MNYRHHFHAGNYADVFKHALLVMLLRGLQQKEKGFLFLDTHAGRGRYDLARAAEGDSHRRTPEWPDGIGRLWTRSGEVPAGLLDYLDVVREFDRRAGNLDDAPRFYPGSPWIARLLARPADRFALYEKHPAEYSALRAEFDGVRRASVHAEDGYAGLRAMLPPRERRALVLIDPPFEAQDEFTRISAALESGLERFPSAAFAIWYPSTIRARVLDFMTTVRALTSRPTLAIELAVASESSALKMKGCGVLVINPPWQFDCAAAPVVEYLAEVLAQEPGGGSRIDWLVPGP
ncbi:MAG: 23S rRNA (adenine(2030)-N(6))-methyltransferase RlmJ [Opitutaceae bacterium]